MKKYDCESLIKIFNRLFQERENTVLVGYAKEPLYRPADQDSIFHQIIFTHDYVSSALHEVAHWCIAGKKRRALIDYGYWYYPDGRDQQQQDLFENVEVKPQALELIFSETLGLPFRVSLDNLSGNTIQDTSHFEQKVRQQAEDYRNQGLPERAEIFNGALIAFQAEKWAQ